ncbi:MAG: hypothetical protein CVV27_03395 [Candidatus Melainabacteria bacterium HGW-Melainabacteria-1]|nr:MAG: hypothetical protein CVV27_03395 [Candidatus Melainabacteria bacterium HGW-Melainabacteria-1]
MKSVIHRARTRGHVNFGWLDSYHSFSFGQYYNPERMNFGVLRVLNDDVVAGGGGFPTHPHDNMEIVSIPLRGNLAHRDSMGNEQVIREGDVQIMSAGTGVRHSEYNHSQTESVNFLQIWVMPKQRDIAPRYAQQRFDPALRQNQLQKVVSGQAEDGLAVWINQDASFWLGNFAAGFKTVYNLAAPDHGVYVFVLEGEIRLGDETLGRRDGIGVSAISQIEIEALADAEILLIDVAMH